MVGVIRARALVGSDLWLLPPGERNDAIFRENRDRPLDEVRAEAEEVHAALVAALATLSEEVGEVPVAVRRDLHEHA